MCPKQYLGSIFPKVHPKGALNGDLLPSDDWLLSRNKPVPLLIESSVKTVVSVVSYVTMVTFACKNAKVVVSRVIFI